MSRLRRLLRWVLLLSVLGLLAGGAAFGLIYASVSSKLPDVQTLRNVELEMNIPLDQPLDIDGELCHVRCTIGASVAPEHGVDPGTLVRSADGALRHARSAADAVAVFDPIAERTAMRRVGLLTELRRGLANHWGYSPIAWLAPEPRYGSGRPGTTPGNELMDAIDAGQGGPRLVATVAQGQMQLHAVLRPRWADKVLGFAEG